MTMEIEKGDEEEKKMKMKKDVKRQIGREKKKATKATQRWNLMVPAGTHRNRKLERLALG